MTSEAIIVGLAVALAAASCADFDRGDPIPRSDGGVEAGGPRSFATDIHPLLSSGCRSCHVEGGSAGETSLVLSDDPSKDYPLVLALVNPANPAGSRLLIKSTGQGHTGGAVFSAGSPEYQRIFDWIQEGAPP